MRCSRSWPSGSRRTACSSSPRHDTGSSALTSRRLEQIPEERDYRELLRLETFEFTILPNLLHEFAPLVRFQYRGMDVVLAADGARVVETLGYPVYGGDDVGLRRLHGVGDP